MVSWLDKVGAKINDRIEQNPGYSLISNMVDVAQLVERLIVVQEVAGS